MFFDESEVYTSLNADELSKGDIVYLADTMATLRRGIEIGDIRDVSILHNILGKAEKFRFEDENLIDYNLAYLICPARNAEAFWAFHDGKKIEMEYADPTAAGTSVWGLLKDEEPNWYKFHYRPTAKETTEIVNQLVDNTKEYRPYNSIDELIAEFKKRFRTQTPAYALPLIWVKSKDKDERYFITGFVKSEQSGQLVKIGNAYYGLGVLFEHYEFLDGSPCGVEK